MVKPQLTQEKYNQHINTVIAHDCACLKCGSNCVVIPKPERHTITDSLGVNKIYLTRCTLCGWGQWVEPFPDWQISEKKNAKAQILNTNKRIDVLTRKRQHEITLINRKYQEEIRDEQTYITELQALITEAQTLGI